MKAYKIRDIKWNLSTVSEDKKAEVINSLPKVISFKKDGEFNYNERVPEMLYKKFGYKTEGFAVSVIRIFDKIEDLITAFMDFYGSDSKSKSVRTASGKLSGAAKFAVNGIKEIIADRIKMEDEGRDVNDMPMFYDVVALSIENIFNIKWMNVNQEEIYEMIDKKFE